jgi:hypothetical protein
MSCAGCEVGDSLRKRLRLSTLDASDQSSDGTDQQRVRLAVIRIFLFVTPSGVRL